MKLGEEMMETAIAQASNSFYLEGLWLNGAKWVPKENSIDEIDNNYEHSTKLPMIHLVIEKYDGTKLGADIKDKDAVVSQVKGASLKANIMGRLGNVSLSLVRNTPVK